MARPGALLVVALGEPLAGELADHVEQLEAGPLVVVDPRQQTLVDEGRGQLERAGTLGSQTRSAASRVHPPRNTASRRKKVRSASSSRS